MATPNISIKDPFVQKIIGGVVILIIMVASWFTQLYSPNKELIQEKRKTLEEFNLKLQSVRLQAGRLEEIEAELEVAFIKYKLLEKLLPTERNVPDFINKINMAARQNNVKISRMDLDPSEIMEFCVADPYRMEVVALYHDFGTFLQDVANLPFIATTRNIQLDRAANGQVKALFVITSYHLPQAERLEAATGAARDAAPQEQAPMAPETQMKMEARSG